MSDLPVTYHGVVLNNPPEVFAELWNCVPWIRHPQSPRRECWMTHREGSYTYGVPPYAREYEPHPWLPTVSVMALILSEVYNFVPDGCFINGYENSRDHLGWHADDSDSIDDGRPIAIFSLGAEREIWFRPKQPDGQVYKFLLESGSLMMMNAGMQDTHQHRIPKASREVGPRISLTFRGLI